MFSHNEGEVWGLEKVDESHVITCGDDNKAVVWNIDTHMCSQVIEVSKENRKARAGGAFSISHKPAS